jgi:hypothetical protein
VVVGFSKLGDGSSWLADYLFKILLLLRLAVGSVTSKGARKPSKFVSHKTVSSYGSTGGDVGPGNTGRSVWGGTELGAVNGDTVLSRTSASGDVIGIFSEISSVIIASGSDEGWYAVKTAEVILLCGVSSASPVVVG